MNNEGGYILPEYMKKDMTKNFLETGSPLVSIKREDLDANEAGYDGIRALKKLFGIEVEPKRTRIAMLNALESLEVPDGKEKPSFRDQCMLSLKAMMQSYYNVDFYHFDEHKQYISLQLHDDGAITYRYKGTPIMWSSKIYTEIHEENGSFRLEAKMDIKKFEKPLDTGTTEDTIE